jgi:hypothetical protein
MVGSGMAGTGMVGPARRGVDGPAGTPTPAPAPGATTPAGTPAAAGSATIRALGDALAAEHAAIYAYGVIGARLTGEQADTAASAELVHRARRDALVLRLAELGAPIPPPEPAYRLPVEVVDGDGARRLAVLVYERAAVVWRAALAPTAGTDRELALDALISCAVWATRWRAAGGVVPTTVPFPGQPA